LHPLSATPEAITMNSIVILILLFSFLIGFGAFVAWLYIEKRRMSASDK
jgi:hypothetical protein